MAEVHKNETHPSLMFMIIVVAGVRISSTFQIRLFQTTAEAAKCLEYLIFLHGPRGGGGVLPSMSYIGMCRCEGYGFQRVYSRIGYRNQRVLV